MLNTRFNPIANYEYRVSSIENRESSIENRVSSIEYRESSIEYRVLYQLKNQAAILICPSETFFQDSQLLAPPE